MSTLRRRLLGGGDTPSPPDDSRDPSPAPITPSIEAPDFLATVPIDKLHELNEAATQRKVRGSKRRNAFIFGFGGLFGLLVAVFFAQQQEIVDLAYLKDFNLDSIIDVLPAGLLHDAQALQQSERNAVSYDSFAVGLHARSQGVQAHHPVIMVPGVISTGLESWGTEDDSRQYFRKRLWGSWSMMRALVMDKAGWKKHIMLDKHTGLDPEGVKMRAAQGFDAADFFITGYWIWNKILENLATIGYDPTNAFTAAYDWRLTYSNLEVRDQYFSRLKNHIEQARQMSGRKVVLLSHSMGSQVLYYFFHWVEAQGAGHGNGGETWVDDHVDSWINISGSMLGAVKDIPALLSGEMSDTAQLNAFAVYGLEKFLSRHERAEVLRAMFGISSMLPMGGDAVWGDAPRGSPDDMQGRNTSFGQFITFRDPESAYARNMTVDQAVPYLLEMVEPWYAQAVRSNYSLGVAHTSVEVEVNQLIPRKWMNPLETRLPKAPNMRIYCFYGYGKNTERAYYYHEDPDPTTKNKVTIDTVYTDARTHADHGVVMGEGDGTVNLMSLGYMCAKGWHMKRYNPANISIVVNEMPHEPEGMNPRGGPKTGDHVDILGRSSLNDLILRVAGGKGDLVEESITSNIRQYADKVQIYEEPE